MTRSGRYKYKYIAVFQESSIPCFCARQSHILRLRQEFPDATVRWCRTRRGFERLLPQMDTAITWAFRQEWFARARCLRLIATPAAGRDFAPLEPPPTVKVLYGTHHGPIMAETVVGMMLAFNRGLYAAYAEQMQGKLWPSQAMYDACLLAGTQAMIVGFGRIGEHIGQQLKNFKVRVTGVRRHVPLRYPQWFEQGDTVVALQDMDSKLPQVDHLILILPSDTDTDQMFDARRLKLLPHQAVLYNVGRGNCLDESALAEALVQRRIRGACLDVFAHEPLAAESPLAANLPGLIRLPHAAAFSRDYFDRFIEKTVQCLKN